MNSVTFLVNIIESEDPIELLNGGSTRDYRESRDELLKEERWKSTETHEFPMRLHYRQQPNLKADDLVLVSIEGSEHIFGVFSVSPSWEQKEIDFLKLLESDGSVWTSLKSRDCYV